MVSIHAPAWGATALMPQANSGRYCFNPRARMGRDDWSTAKWGQMNGFNPRARMGRDN